MVSYSGDAYNALYGNITPSLMAGPRDKCMSQCTGCKCSCSSKCKYTDNRPEVTMKNGRFFDMSATSNDYAQMFGNIGDFSNVSMAKCACVKCNSCTCACSCARCKRSPEKEDIDW